jgi:enoyl-CoA hydratase
VSTGPEPVRYAVDGGVARLTLNRPEKRNAIDLAMMRILADRVEQAAADPSVACLVLDGAEGSFCAGGDLTAEMDEIVFGAGDMLAATRRVISGLVHAPKPVIAAVEGPAVGAGAALAFASDLVVAAASSYFIIPFVGVGLIPDAGASATVAASVGRARAMRMALRRERLTARDALAAGLVAAVCEVEELATTVDEWAADLASGPRSAIAQTKALINGRTLPDLDQALDREAEVQVVQLASDDFRTAVEAFTRRS